MADDLRALRLPDEEGKADAPALGVGGQLADEVKSLSFNVSICDGVRSDLDNIFYLLDKGTC